MAIKANRKGIQALNTLCDGRRRAPQLRVLVPFIHKWLPELEAELVRSHTSTDRKYAGSRIRWPGAGRNGNKLVVKNKATRSEVFSHDASCPDRWNGEVVSWIAKQLGEADHLKFAMRWLCP